MAVEVIGFREIRTLAFWRDCAAELIATLILVAVQCASPLSFGKDPPHSVFSVGMSMGMVVFVLAESFGPMGGGHFNPAVSFSMVVGRQVSILRGIFYIIFQCLGGLGGAGLIYGVTPPQHRETLAATVPQADLSAVLAMVVEMWITANLVFVVWGSTNKERHGGQLFMPSLAIGFTVGLGITVAGEYTGASMNPARSLGPAVVMNIWQDHWVYWAGPFLGGLFATLIYHYCLDKVKDPKPSGDDLPLHGKDNLGYNDAHIDSRM